MQSPGPQLSPNPVQWWEGDSNDAEPEKICNRVFPPYDLSNESVKFGRPDPIHEIEAGSMGPL